MLLVLDGESGSTLQMLDALSSVASAAVALIALIVSWRINQSLRRQQQVNNIPRLFFEEYADAVLSVPITLQDGEPHRDIETLKEARESARRQRKDAKTWQRFIEQSRNEGCWENRVAYEISLAIQKVGASVFVGAIPLDFILATSATQIVEDWTYCHELVRRIRSDYRPPTAGQSHSVNAGYSEGRSVGYHRRHGEWLSYVAAIWLHQHWNSEELERFLNVVAPVPPQRRRGDAQIKCIQERTFQIQQIDRDIASDVTLKHVRRILSPTSD